MSAQWWDDRLARYPLPKRRTLRRRNLDYAAIYDLTIDRGRPNKGIFIQCGNPQCLLCGYKDFCRVVDIWPRDKNGNWTRWREKFFFEATVAHFWGSVPRDKRDKAGKRRCVESFVYSPPVRGAFAHFSVYMRQNDRNMKDDTSSMATALTKHRSTFVTYLQALRNGTLYDDSDHWMFFMRNRHIEEYPFHWTMETFIAQFILIAESWRSFAVAQQGAKLWDFPGADDVGKMVDFLSAVLLNFTDMRGRRSLGVYAYNGFAHNRSWTEWDDEYQVFTEELKRRDEAREKWWARRMREKEAKERGETLTKEELDAVGEVVEEVTRDGEECLEGYGKGADEHAWKTKRMLRSQGMSVPGYKP